MRKKKNKDSAEPEILDRILLVRGKRVMLDSDLARLYGVETKRLKEQVRRNIERFPERFMFELTREEAEFSRSQFATLKQGSNIKYLPYAFTEHGILMLANVLKTDRAIKMSIRIIDVFVQMRSHLQTNREILLKVELLEHQIFNQDRKMSDFEKDLELILETVKALLSPENERKKIGYEIGKKKENG